MEPMDLLFALSFIAFLLAIFAVGAVAVLYYTPKQTESDNGADAAVQAANIASEAYNMAQRALNEVTALKTSTKPHKLRAPHIDKTTSP